MRDSHVGALRQGGAAPTLVVRVPGRLIFHAHTLHWAADEAGGGAIGTAEEGATTVHSLVAAKGPARAGPEGGAAAAGGLPHLHGRWQGSTKDSPDQQQQEERSNEDLSHGLIGPKPCGQEGGSSWRPFDVQCAGRKPGASLQLKPSNTQLRRSSLRNEN